MTQHATPSVPYALWVAVMATKGGRYAFTLGNEPEFFPGFLSIDEIVRALVDEAVPSSLEKPELLLEEATLRPLDCPGCDPIVRQDLDVVARTSAARAPFRSRIYFKQFLALCGPSFDYLMAIGGRPFRFPSRFSLAELNDRLAEDRDLFEELEAALLAAGVIEHSDSELRDYIRSYLRIFYVPLNSDDLP